MGKQPVRMRAVVYALSPFQQKIMSGLWKDVTGKISHKVSENWINATLLLGPLVGTYTDLSNLPLKAAAAAASSVVPVTFIMVFTDGMCRTTKKKRNWHTGIETSRRPPFYQKISELL
ncbi:hypothetical protein DITRI_Ditri18aG0002000 [Diplodiscus trichospermus]